MEISRSSFKDIIKFDTIGHINSTLVQEKLAKDRSKFPKKNSVNFITDSASDYSISKGNNDRRMRI